MIKRNDLNGHGGFSSSPCFMHEVDPAYSGLPDPRRMTARATIQAWRNTERARLIAERLALGRGIRLSHGKRIAAALDEAIESVEGLTVSAYWPFRGEPDLRGLLERVISRGGQCALPVVVERGKPLVFRLWAPGDPLTRGVWNILIPAEGAEVVPDVVIAPVVGFDPACYRLGYGGGYYDRTLAALPTRPRICGVGYAQAAIPTIYPQPHDIPMDAVVTETGTIVRSTYTEVRSP